MSNPKNKIEYTAILSVEMETDGEPGTDEAAMMFVRGAIDLVNEIRQKFPDFAYPAEIIPFAMSADPEKI